MSKALRRGKKEDIQTSKIREPATAKTAMKVAKTETVKRASTKQKDTLASREEVNRLVVEVSESILEEFDLKNLFTVQDIRDIVENTIRDYVESGKKIEAKSLIKRFEIYRDELYKFLASKIISENRELNNEIIEFIVYRAPEIAGKATPLLYKASIGAPHIIASLRELWERYGNPTLLRCPRCMFKSLTPDFYCLVCGATPGEAEIKTIMRFEDELRYAASQWHSNLIIEALNSGYVYYDGEIKPPSLVKNRTGVLFHLSTKEKNILREILNK
ncbi:MAG: hypothetical protein QXR02_05300 [Acidilobaceae archaeon]